MTSRKNINIFDFNGVNVAKHWHVAGEVFAISDCLVYIVSHNAFPVDLVNSYLTMTWTNRQKKAVFSVINNTPGTHRDGGTS